MSRYNKNPKNHGISHRFAIFPRAAANEEKGEADQPVSFAFRRFHKFYLLPQIFFRQALMGNHSQSRQMSASISLVIFSSISRIKS